jgi:hypothetical protein
MDRDWMRERLEEFRAVCEDYAHSSEGDYVGDRRVRARMHRLEPTARAVLRALDAELANFNLDTMAGEYEGIKAADRGLGMLADLDDVAARLRPEAPALPADQLHPGSGMPLERSGMQELTLSPSSRRPRASPPIPSRRPSASWRTTTL